MKPYLPAVTIVAVCILVSFSPSEAQAFKVSGWFETQAQLTSPNQTSAAVPTYEQAALTHNKKDKIQHASTVKRLKDYFKGGSKKKRRH